MFGQERVAENCDTPLFITQLFIHQVFIKNHYDGPIAGQIWCFSYIAYIALLLVQPAPPSSFISAIHLAYTSEVELFACLYPILEKESTVLLLLLLCHAHTTPYWILKRSGLKRSGQRLILSIGKIREQHFFSCFFRQNNFSFSQFSIY